MYIYVHVYIYIYIYIRLIRLSCFWEVAASHARRRQEARAAADGGQGYLVPDGQAGHPYVSSGVFPVALGPEHPAIPT